MIVRATPARSPSAVFRVSEWPVATDSMLSYFGVQYDFFANKAYHYFFYDYPPVLDVAPSIAFLCYAFIKIKLASRHLLLYVVYRCQKLVNFVDACDCYKQK